MIKKIFKCLVPIVAAFTMISCNSDDTETPVDVVVEDSWSSQISRLCNIIGINKEDYYDYWGVNGYNDKVVVVNSRKKDDKVYVALLDTIQNNVVFTDTYFGVLQSMEANYYENKYTYNLTGFYPTYCENDEGFAVVINAHYGSEETIDAKFVQKIIFNDGFHNSYLELAANSYVTPYKWYGNSYLLRIRGNNYASCYDGSGQLLYKNLYIPYYENTCPVSYTEYIDFGNNSSLGKFQIGKKNAVSDQYDWITDVALVDDATDDMRITYTYQSQTNDVWTFLCKIVSRNGSVQNKYIHLNILTGEYSLT